MHSNMQFGFFFKNMYIEMPPYPEIVANNVVQSKH